MPTPIVGLPAIVTDRSVHACRYRGRVGTSVKRVVRRRGAKPGLAGPLSRLRRCALSRLGPATCARSGLEAELVGVGVLLGDGLRVEDDPTRDRVLDEVGHALVLA